MSLTCPYGISGTPHYETITPDCRRVRDDYRISGYDFFDDSMDMLKRN